MIRVVRKYLELSREQMAWYLRLSTSMVKKMELGQRQLPYSSMGPVVKIFQAIQDIQTNGPASDPPFPSGHHTRRMKRVYRECRHALELRTDELKQMQRDYASACFNLRVYQLLAQSLPPAESNDDRFRLKWIKWMTEDTLQRLKEIDPAAQDFLIAEIAGLKSKMDVLEGTALFQSI
jgi:hypothetical protein